MTLSMTYHDEEKPMAFEDGVITAYVLDGRGGGTEIGWSDIRNGLQMTVCSCA